MTWNAFLHKTLTYLSPTVDYWRRNAPTTQPKHPAEPGPYPMDFGARLFDGHFDRFDERGLPVRPHRYDRSRTTHFYSTMCTFAFGHWDAYLAKGDDEALRHSCNVADYLVESADRDGNGSAIMRGPGPDGGEHTGAACALTQGMAMCLLTRVWHATKEEKYRQTALECVRPFDVSVTEGGVRGRFEESGRDWFEEEVLPPPRHILNGMIYGLWGLYDTGRILGDTRAAELFAEGAAAVEASLPLFDTGYWSLYWKAEGPGRSYVASMNYHNLHICQLECLASQANLPRLAEYSKRFARYSASPVNRIRAAAAIARAKLDGRTR